MNSEISERQRIESLITRVRNHTSIAPDKIFDPEFQYQKEFVTDPAKLKSLFCTRRAAKSFTAGLYLVYEALKNPNCNCLFIGLTRESAKNIILKDILSVINRQFNLRTELNKSSLTVTFPNGSVIFITGVDADESDMDKLLGKKYRLVCIDEASMYTINLRHLVYDILKPAMTDLRGTIALFGTASNYTRGLFYDITTGKEPGWSKHSWSALDNPYVRENWLLELEEIRTQRPLYMETPQYRQWYLNEWVIETDKLVYKFNESRNTYLHLPPLAGSGWNYGLGVDLGWEDDTAFTLGAWHDNDPNFYVIDSWGQTHLPFEDKPGLPSVVSKINEYISDKAREPSIIVIDGANKQGVESMRLRSSIPFVYADKQGKVDFIEMMNADLVQGRLKIPATSAQLINEMMSLVWKTDGDKIIIPKKEHPSLPNHRCDSLLYLWRMGYHYQSSAAEKKPVVGSREWYLEQSKDVWEKEREKLENEQNPSGFPEEGGWSSL